TDSPGGNHSYECTPSENIANFSKAGFRLFQLDLWFNDIISEDGRLDISEAQRQVDGVLKHCPDAAVMFRLHINPPLWWLNKNPSEWVRYADAEVQPTPYKAAHIRPLWMDLEAVPHISFASERWRECMSQYLAEFCQKFADTPQGRHIMGIQLASGTYGEYHNWAFTKHEPDTSEPMLRFFRSYLRDKYGSDKALRKAWNDPDVSIETVPMPMMERLETTEGIFRNPECERRYSDYYEALNKAVTRSILHSASVVKANWPRPVLTGCFYGYYFSLFGRQATGGHIFEEDILNSADIDFVCAPQAYNKNSRKAGGPGLSRGLIESVNLHGKLWLDEMDQPSHYGYIELGGLEKFPKPQSIQILRKFVLEPFVRGGGMWYYDFGPRMTSGWWDDPDYMSEIAAIRRLEEKYFHRQSESPADVLLVFDTKVFLHTAPRPNDDPITDQISVNISAVNAFKSGASVATCYLSDLQKMPLDCYKAVVFVNCYLMEPALRKWIRANVATGGRSLFWLTAPAYNDGTRLSAANVCDASGIRLEAFKSAEIPDICYAANLGGFAQTGESMAGVDARTAEQTFFRVSDPSAEALGFFNDGTTACAFKAGRDANDYFFALPPVEPSVWQALFRRAGCHIYDREGDSVIAGSGLLLIHTAEGGRREICLRNGRIVAVELAPVQTIVIDAESGEIL
ncbi:MAG: hypothetical protein HUJ91_07495, partial [Bacteroidales bacterium]|nr:hypothetical protein [Bacteroidales bacterium]